MPTFDEIARFISIQTSTPINKIKPATTLENDLSIYGDDAFELIAALAEKYDIDLSGFVFTKYFSQEDSIGHLIKKIFRQNKHREQLTVQDLFQASQMRKLL